MSKQVEQRLAEAERLLSDSAHVLSAKVTGDCGLISEILSFLDETPGPLPRALTEDCWGYERSDY